MKFIATNAELSLEIPNGKVTAVEAIEGEAVGDTHVTFYISREAAEEIKAIINREMAAVVADIASGN